MAPAKTPKSFDELVRARRSIRRFKGDPVDPEAVREVMDTARFSPSPTNRQCVRFVGVSDKILLQAVRQEVLKKSDEIARNLEGEAANAFHEYSRWFAFFDQAPLTVFGQYRVFASRLPGEKKTAGRLEGLAEVQAFGGAVHALLLAFFERGLASCWMSGPLIAQESIENLLRIERPWRLGAVIPIGFPEQTPPVPRKPDLESYFSWFPG